eukprot:GEMP01010421.1.p1 GENE.GEMP01010421.1~~GEMP01010421.1.p1  ORF type:complete len:844 (+),score=222.25 GEMP01010421.1:173-2704(+)
MPFAAHFTLFADANTADSANPAPHADNWSLVERAWGTADDILPSVARQKVAASAQKSTSEAAKLSDQAAQNLQAGKVRRAGDDTDYTGAAGKKKEAESVAESERGEEGEDTTKGAGGKNAEGKVEEANGGHGPALDEEKKKAFVNSGVAATKRAVLPASETKVGTKNALFDAKEDPGHKAAKYGKAFLQWEGNTFDGNDDNGNMGTVVGVAKDLLPSGFGKPEHGTLGAECMGNMTPFGRTTKQGPGCIDPFVCSTREGVARDWEKGTCQTLELKGVKRCYTLPTDDLFGAGTCESDELCEIRSRPHLPFGVFGYCKRGAGSVCVGIEGTGGSGNCAYGSQCTTEDSGKVAGTFEAGICRQKQQEYAKLGCYKVAALPQSALDPVKKEELAKVGPKDLVAACSRACDDQYYFGVYKGKCFCSRVAADRMQSAKAGEGLPVSALKIPEDANCGREEAENVVLYKHFMQHQGCYKYSRDDGALCTGGGEKSEQGSCPDHYWCKQIDGKFGTWAVAAEGEGGRCFQTTKDEYTCKPEIHAGGTGAENEAAPCATGFQCVDSRGVVLDEQTIKLKQDAIKGYEMFSNIISTKGAKKTALTKKLHGALHKALGPSTGRKEWLLEKDGRCVPVNCTSDAECGKGMSCQPVPGGKAPNEKRCALRSPTDSLWPGAKEMWPVRMDEPTQCSRYCASYRYFGLRSGGHGCICSNIPPPQDKKIVEGASGFCSAPCDGDGNYQCGGQQGRDSSVNVYKHDIRLGECRKNARGECTGKCSANDHDQCLSHYGCVWTPSNFSRLPLHLRPGGCISCEELEKDVCKMSDACAWDGAKNRCYPKDVHVIEVIRRTFL